MDKLISGANTGELGGLGRERGLSKPPPFANEGASHLSSAIPAMDDDIDRDDAEAGIPLRRCPLLGLRRPAFGFSGDGSHWNGFPLLDEVETRAETGDN
jgi:hypothetical protein